MFQRIKVIKPTPPMQIGVDINDFCSVICLRVGTAAHFIPDPFATKILESFDRTKPNDNVITYDDVPNKSIEKI